MVAGDRARSLRWKRRWKVEHPQQFRIQQRAEGLRRTARERVKRNGPLWYWVGREERWQPTSYPVWWEAYAEAWAEHRAEARARKPWLKSGLTAGERFNIRYRCDPAFNTQIKLKASFRRRSWRSNIAWTLRNAIKTKNQKRLCSIRIETELGYTWQELATHLELKFAPGMTWQKFFDNEIDIDHIRPIGMFNWDATCAGTPINIRKAWALTNLQPLWVADHKIKSAHDRRMIAAYKVAHPCPA